MDISARHHAVIIAFDDPECGGAADALEEQLSRELKAIEQRLNLPKVAQRLVPVVPGASHRDSVARTLQELVSVKPQDVFVVSLLKGAGAEEYRALNDACQKSRPPIEHQVVTHMASFSDVGLIVRNLVRQAIALITRDAVSPSSAME